MGLKTVNDAYKEGRAEALQQLNLYFTSPNPTSPKGIVEAGVPPINKDSN